ncbi:hypothetical protein H0X32_00210 [Patescibacteria group bacterium]|nr:hypothetical protein [Patescibacteria group bacterium]
MRKIFRCEPPPTRGAICIARIHDRIVGSLVLQSTKHDCPFPIEDHYDFDPKEMPFPFSRSEVVQATRWIATEPGVSLRVVKACGWIAHGFEKRYMFIEAKPYSVERLCELGLDCRIVKNAVLVPERVRESVGEAGIFYYTEHPLPTLCIFPIAPLLI